MATCKDVLAAMEVYAPVSLAEDWDNVGMLVENTAELTGILTALDIDEDVIREAQSLNCNLIVTHHPVIFDPLKRMEADGLAFRLIKNGMGAICMHTNLDAAPMGVNEMLARLLGIENREAFIPCGRIGDVPETNAAELAQKCAINLGAAVKYVDGGKPIRRVAVISGAGGSLMEDALKAGADALVTGEGSHHVALDAKLAGLSLIVAGHYATEYPIVPILARYLGKKFPTVPVFASQRGKDPFQYILK